MDDIKIQAILTLMERTSLEELKEDLDNATMKAGEITGIILPYIEVFGLPVIVNDKNEVPLSFSAKYVVSTKELKNQLILVEDKKNE